MSLFPKNPNEADYIGGKKHFVDVIKNRSDNDTLIFQNPEEDFNNGTTLVVDPGEVAIFVNNGNIEQVFENGSYQLSTQNYPFITRLRTSLSGGISAFNCKVYFVRTATSREILWGTDTALKVNDKSLADPINNLGVETEVRAHGSYRIKVSNAQMFLTQLIGSNYDLRTQESLNEFFRSQFHSHIIARLRKALSAHEGPLNEIPAMAEEIGDEIGAAISGEINEYGLQVIKFAVATIDIVENDLRREAKQAALEQRKIAYGAQAERMRYDALGTNYQQAESFDVMKRAASNEGSTAAPLMGAGMGLGMGVGFGQAMQGMMGASMGNPAAMQQSPNGQMPPTAAPMGGGVPGQMPPQSAAPAADDITGRLQKLKGLLDSGLISQEEFDAKKQAILEEL